MQIVILGQNQEALDQIYAETNQSGQMEPELYVLFIYIPTSHTFHLYLL